MVLSSSILSIGDETKESIERVDSRAQQEETLAFMQETREELGITKELGTMEKEPSASTQEPIRENQ
jgi:hypothetical protein